jgi:hypothetical protein
MLIRYGGQKRAHFSSQGIVQRCLKEKTFEMDFRESEEVSIGRKSKMNQ